jgi:protease II
VPLRGAPGAGASAPLCDRFPATLVAPREAGRLYRVDHFRPPPSSDPRLEAFPILTNVGGAVNFRLVAARAADVLSRAGAGAWREILPPSHDRYLVDLDVFERFWALEGREGGSTQVWMLDGADVERALAAAFGIRGGEGAAAEGGGASAPAPSPAAGGAPSLTLHVLPPRDAVYVLEPDRNKN